MIPAGPVGDITRQTLLQLDRYRLLPGMPVAQLDVHRAAVQATLHTQGVTR